MWWLFVFSVVVSSVFSASIPKGLTAIYEYDPRIVGGEPINIDRIPYMAAVVFYGAQYCGASIIKPNLVMTAAHCIPGITERRTKIRVGSSSRSTGLLLPIRKILAHENFVTVTQGNDVALIWLESPVIFSTTVQMIALPEQDETVQPGSVGLVSGWGYISERGTIPDHLRAVQVPIVDRTHCKAIYQLDIDLDMICAGYTEGGKDACQLDSGGPMMIANKVVGIVSWGQGCAQPDTPGVYTNVAHFVTWISDKISKYS